MLKQLRTAVLFGVPLVVGILNLRHPVLKPPIYSGIVPHLSWWITLHLLNLILFPLLGLAAYLLVKMLATLQQVFLASRLEFLCQSMLRSMHWQESAQVYWF